jgi:hypothetical protein
MTPDCEVRKEAKREAGGRTCDRTPRNCKEGDVEANKSNQNALSGQVHRAVGRGLANSDADLRVSSVGLSNVLHSYIEATYDGDNVLGYEHASRTDEQETAPPDSVDELDSDDRHAC